ncbi:unnamed protein product [Brassica oleracea]
MSISHNDNNGEQVIFTMAGRETISWVSFMGILVEEFFKHKEGKISNRSCFTPMDMEMSLTTVLERASIEFR